MSNETDKQLFEDAIRADRYDGVTRQIFADWLEEHGFDDEAAIQRSWTPEKQQAEDWLTEYAREHNLVYADLIRMANHFLDTGATFAVDPNSWDEFWQRFSILTGRNPEEVHSRADLKSHPGYEVPCGECPWHWESDDPHREEEPYGDDFHNERGW